MLSDGVAHSHIIYMLAEKLQVKSYLELGVYDGQTIGQVATIVPYCVGVDIKPFGPIANVLAFVESTDTFIRVNLKTTFDMVFIDADHSYEAVKRDFWGVFTHVKNDGIILLHDTYPESESYTSTGYCGDSYKFAQELHEHKDILESMTLPYSPGLTIVRKRTKQIPWI